MDPLAASADPHQHSRHSAISIGEADLPLADISNLKIPDTGALRDTEAPPHLLTLGSMGSRICCKPSEPCCSSPERELLQPAVGAARCQDSACSQHTTPNSPDPCLDHSHSHSKAHKKHHGQGHCCSQKHQHQHQHQNQHKPISCHGHSHSHSSSVVHRETPTAASTHRHCGDEQGHLHLGQPPKWAPSQHLEAPPCHDQQAQGREPHGSDMSCAEQGSAVGPALAPFMAETVGAHVVPVGEVCHRLTPPACGPAAVSCCGPHPRDASHPCSPQLCPSRCEAEHVEPRESTAHLADAADEQEQAPAQAKEQVVRIHVAGLCCAGEVPLVKRILERAPHVTRVDVSVPTRTVVVHHSGPASLAHSFVEALNAASLGASLRETSGSPGRDGASESAPSSSSSSRGMLSALDWGVEGCPAWPPLRMIASGALLALSSCSALFAPMAWMALGAVAVGIPHIARRSVASLRVWVLDFNTLVLVAVVGACALGSFSEAASVVFLFLLAEHLEGTAASAAQDSIESLLSLTPHTATVLAHPDPAPPTCVAACCASTQADTGDVGQVEGAGLQAPAQACCVPMAEGEEVAVECVPVGSVVSVKPGGVVPVDGVVVRGRSAVDEKCVTGEATPTPKQPGDNVFAGTVNTTGYLEVRTTALAQDSAMARLVRLVEESHTQRSRRERIVESFARIYTPCIVALSLGLALWPLLMGLPNALQYCHVALVLLVAACPCSLVLSTPLVWACGVARAAQSGVLVKGGAHLEALAEVEVVALDKTGTLTQGDFSVHHCLTLGEPPLSPASLMRWVSSVEALSSHPLGPALVRHAQALGVELGGHGEVEEFEMVEGEGVTALVAGTRVHVGSTRMALRLGWHDACEGAFSSGAEEWERKGCTIVWVGVEGQAAGVLGVGDRVRPEAEESLRDLHGVLHLHLALLTGDSPAAAAAVAQQVTMPLEVHAGLLPGHKVGAIHALKASSALSQLSRPPRHYNTLLSTPDGGAPTSADCDYSAESDSSHSSQCSSCPACSDRSIDSLERGDDDVASVPLWPGACKEEEGCVEVQFKVQGDLHCKGSIEEPHVLQGGDNLTAWPWVLVHSVLQRMGCCTAHWAFSSPVKSAYSRASTTLTPSNSSEGNPDLHHLPPQQSAVWPLLLQMVSTCAALLGSAWHTVASTWREVAAEVSLLKGRRVVAMVGDGLNDTPALAAADVGIAIGAAGCAAAMEVADVALLTTDLRLLGRVIRLGRTCTAKVRSNVALSVGVKAVVVALTLCGYASLWLALLADMGTTMAVIVNSLLILDRRGVDQDEQLL